MRFKDKQRESRESVKQRVIKGGRGGVRDVEHTEDTEAEIDIQHVIAPDRPAHPSRFLFGVEI